MDTFVIIAATASLLILPGPTNVLLATAGAEQGFFLAARLLTAVVAGYALAVFSLECLVGPLIAKSPNMDLALRAGVLAYLVIIALRLWRRGDVSKTESAAVSWQALFVTTVFNPKSIVFTFAILPGALTNTALILWIGVFSLIAAAVGLSWILLGSTLRRGCANSVSADVAYKISAIAVIIVAGTISAHAFA